MKMKLVKTGRVTTVTKDEWGYYQFKEAANRLICREAAWKGHFAWRPVGWDNLPDEFEAEVCRGLPSGTEHTGKKVWFSLIHEGGGSNKGGGEK